MAQEQVNIVINKDGSVTVGVECVAGPGCQELTRSIENALGKVVSDQPTPDMFETEVNNATANQY